MKFVAYSLMFCGAALSNMVLYTMFLGPDGIDYHDIILLIISLIGFSTFIVGAGTLRTIAKNDKVKTPYELRLARRQRRRKALAKI